MRSKASYERQKEAKRRDYRWYREHGICVYCHQADAVPGMQACCDCLYKRQMKRIEKSSEEERAKQAEYRRAWRAKHKAAGLCSECNQPAINGTTRCRKHQILHNAQKAFKKVYAVQDYSKCLLVACNEPVLPGKRYCEKHYQMKRDVAMKNMPKNNNSHIWRGYDHMVFSCGKKEECVDGNL